MTDHTTEPQETPLRRCTKCHEVKPATLEYFFPRKEGKYGLRSECRNCMNKRCNEWSIRKAREQGVQPAGKKGDMIPCAECGKMVYRTPSRTKGENTYCSLSCFGIAQGRKQTGEGNPRFNSVEVPCAECGKFINRSAYFLDNRDNHFCSPACRGQWQAKNLAGPNSPTYTKVDVLCLECGTKISIVPSQIAKNGNFCSRQCVKSYRGPTSIEAILDECLKETGREYVAEYKIGRFSADFFVAPNFVFEADGEYWHAMPETIARDKRRDEYMHDQGYLVTRFSESMILNHRDEVLSIIKKVLSTSAAMGTLG